VITEQIKLVKMSKRVPSKVRQSNCFSGCRCRCHCCCHCQCQPLHFCARHIRPGLYLLECMLNTPDNVNRCRHQLAFGSNWI